MSAYKIFDIAGSGMTAQSVRMNTTVSNIANANSVSSSRGPAAGSRESAFSIVESAQSKAPPQRSAIAVFRWRTARRASRG